MSKKYNVVALGELLIDFIPADKSINNKKLFEAYEGGAPANVLAMVSKLSGKTAFIGKVGKDGFGDMLKKALVEQNIDASGLVIDENYCTTLAFVSLDEANNRSFTFCRKPGADMMLSVDEVNYDLIKNSDIFHFGTLSLTKEPIITATKTSVNIAKENNCLISFDPNIRELLWSRLDDAILQMKYGLSVCDILKISEEELYLITDYRDIKQAINWLTNQYPNIKLAFVTCGDKGSYFKYKNELENVSAFSVENVIDTTGAGDTFFGCCLYFISTIGVDNLNKKGLCDIVRYANAAGALNVTKRGAFSQMPADLEIKNFIIATKEV